MFKLQALEFLCLMLSLHQHQIGASYAELPNVYNSPPNGYAFATPVPCDLPPPPLEGYGATAYAKPLVFASYPFSYAAVPRFNYAAPVAPTFVKYAPEPRIKATAGHPVTTTFTTALGFAAPAPAPNIGSPHGFATAPAPPTYGAPHASYGAELAYAAPSAFIGSATYAAPSFLAPTPLVRKFRGPLPGATYSYGQGVPNGAW